MNKHSSILWLMIQSSFSKIMALLAGISAVQLALFVLAFQQLSVAEYSLEQTLVQGQAARVAAVGFLGVTWLLTRTGNQKGGQIGYTLQRLAVSEREVFWWQALYNGGCYLILWVAQVLTMLGLGVLYTKMADPAMVTSQTILLACYRSRYLSSLLPLARMGRWLRLFVMLVGLALSSAHYPFAKRHGKPGNELILMTAWTVFTFIEYTSPYETYYSVGANVLLRGPWFITSVSVLVITVVLWQVLRRGADHDEV